MRTTAKGLEYPNKFYWDYMVNPNATIENGLANCTTFVYGAIKEDGHLPPVSSIVGANSWHKVLINGWMQIPYNEAKIESGDIIQWVDKCHVAIVSDSKKNISGSFYTGMHGRAYYDGKFDTRDFKSLEEMCNWMIVYYPKRFFHHWPIEEECNWVGGMPNNILKHPLYSVERDIDRNQIEVLGYSQNVRNNENDIICRAEKGFFNVISTREENGYLWYQVEKGKYIAQVDGRVVFHGAIDSDIERLRIENEQLKAENEYLKNVIEEVHELTILED